jgi:hypothetical protein
MTLAGTDWGLRNWKNICSAYRTETHPG